MPKSSRSRHQSAAFALIEQARKTQASALDLSSQVLAELPESIGRLTQLHLLNLSDNQLTVLPEVLGQLTQIQSLDLSENPLTTLPDWIGQLTKLQSLDLRDNELAVLPRVLSQLTQLRYLYLGSNKLTALPDWIGQLTKLQSLYVESNQLTALPESLGRLRKLESLALSFNRLRALPDWISQLTKLRSLDLSNNQLTVLPDWIDQLRWLRCLHLSENELAALPDALRNLTSLTELYIHGNATLALPPEVAGPTWQDVQEKPRARPAKPSAILDYYFRTRGGRRPLAEGEAPGPRRASQTIPVPKPSRRTGQTIASALIEEARKTRASGLDLCSRRLTRLPETIGQLTQLQSLLLSSNKLTALPEAFGQFTQLQSLDLGLNQLTTLPEAFSQLTQLEDLGLWSNRLTVLPESIRQLTRLRSLNLYGNQLTALPEWIGQLTQLESLNLGANQLTALPEALKGLISLTKLFLDGNPGLALPPEVVGPSWLDVVGRSPAKPAEPSTILDYYFRTRGGRRPLNEAKLILVGRGAVGKTSLVNRLIHNQFSPAEKKTDGIRITPWPLRLHGLEEVRLNIWDFGGQEIMHATHQFFLTERSLYLLVINGREGGEDADADYWLKLIESFGGESPVIVVLNKIKEHPFDLNRRALQQKYPSIRDFIQTDCEDATGLADLHQSIESETGRLRHLRDDFPSSWFSIKDRLGGMSENYLGFEEYRRVCAELGESESSAQEALATHLHHLGIALNYREDARLRDTHVLNPHWVTNGIYKVLNSPRLQAQKGEIRLSDLTEILDQGAYPERMHLFLIDLMRKFDLCFNFPDDDVHYLIPELLDKQQPPEAARFEPAECLCFEYHYPVLPEGLLPRFIVRTHVLSQQPGRWRTGVILSFEGNRALVKADVPDKKVSIYVAGPKPGRRRLLAVIRSDLDRIHGEIRKLKPEEMVPLPGHPEAVVPYQELTVMEQAGIPTFPKVVDGSVIQADVDELLSGVDLADTRPKERTLDPRRQTVRLFMSYSHKDETFRNELETHLKLMLRMGLIDVWHDRRIGAGDEWKEQIDGNMERADIIVLLVSADFIASDYCYEKEMTRALERHKAEEARVIPVLVRDVNWRGAPFGGLQTSPREGLAVARWPDRDFAWRTVSEEIEAVVKEIRQASAP